MPLLALSSETAGTVVAGISVVAFGMLVLLVLMSSPVLELLPEKAKACLCRPTDKSND
jgi:hypothetical protein